MLRLRTIFIAVTLATAAFSLNAQTTRELRPTCDSLQVLMQERTSVEGELVLKRVTRRGSYLDLRFNASLGNYPWRADDVEWFKEKFIELAPESCKKYSVGNIFVETHPLSDYVMPEAGNDGRPVSTLFRTDMDPRPEHPFVEQKDGMRFNKGLSGRNIALWQSHGRYYEEKTDRWEWQRAPIFQTVEDLYTQSYVLPFLIPMLENAGAYVMTPRERDTQRNEIIMDNDHSFGSDRAEDMRIEGEYEEKGNWEDCGVGFADAKTSYTGVENPFRMGTARQISCREEGAKAIWTPDIPENGEYSVYISYKSLPHSTQCAHYTVNHAGGATEFYVNQKIGGGTWIYLGTFEFKKGNDASVTLDADVPESRNIPRNAVLTADAVRIGGGMGKIARGPKDAPASEYVTSGMPSYTEGALYWMQWAGVDSTILQLHEDDYTSDYADRGAWVGWMSGGSRTNPNGVGLGIPIDLSFAFHSDAGTYPNDSIVGTLSIYTLKCDGSDKLPNGESRLQARMLCDFTQTQIVNDIRFQFEPEWARRGLWDRSYSESRTTTVPAMLLELLSHQNFADMKYGLDPSFRFTVSRAVYKGMLKYLSNRYGCQYAVQPLPVNSFATSFKNISGSGNARVEISWKPTKDSLEATADPTGYILYTRIDDGPFDGGTIVSSTDSSVSVTKNIVPGHVYSYKVVAYNEGGKSFPSEVLCVGVPKYSKSGNVLIVNNFTRVSPPAWFDFPEYAGFRNDIDAGVPYMKEINFIGEQFEYRRSLPWMDDDNPGFGASFSDKAGSIVLGNTFDFSYIHGKAIMAAGHAFHSVSTAAFQEDSSFAENDYAIDLLCGKQVTTMVGSGRKPSKYQVFPLKLQNSLRSCAESGKNLLVTGSRIGTDVWDSIYPLQKDSAYTIETKAFVESVLGYRHMSDHATRNARLSTQRRPVLKVKAEDLDFYNTRNSKIYCVEQADGIVPASKDAGSIFKYSDSDISAGIYFKGKNYKTVCLGFPFETIKKEEGRAALMSAVLSFFSKN
jgi:hypothetical protein